MARPELPPVDAARDVADAEAAACWCCRRERRSPRAADPAGQGQSGRRPEACLVARDWVLWLIRCCGSTTRLATGECLRRAAALELAGEHHVVDSAEERRAPSLALLQADDHGLLPFDPPGRLWHSCGSGRAHWSGNARSPCGNAAAGERRPAHAPRVRAALRRSAGSQEGGIDRGGGPHAVTGTRRRSLTTARNDSVVAGDLWRRHAGCVDGRQRDGPARSRQRRATGRDAEHRPGRGRPFAAERRRLRRGRAGVDRRDRGRQRGDRSARQAARLPAQRRAGIRGVARAGARARLVRPER